MARCMYHESVAVAVCPGCDFEVCKGCLARGAEGVCETCSEERATRRKSSAVAREYVVTKAVAKCSHCRTDATDEAPLDGHGFCTACGALPRCVRHGDQIADSPCKDCKRKQCRQCIGFDGVCRTCKAKRKIHTAKLAAGEIDAMGRPVKGARTRGRKALEAKIQSRVGDIPIQRLKAIGAGVLGVFVVAAFAFAPNQSTEARAKIVREQMVTVHRAVIYKLRLDGRMPSGPAEITKILVEQKVPGASAIKISMDPINQPGAVIYFRSQRGFMITGSDPLGHPVLTDKGEPLKLDQFYDSGTN